MANLFIFTHRSPFSGDIRGEDLCLQFRLAHGVVEARSSYHQASQVGSGSQSGVGKVKVVALDAQLRFIQHCVADQLVVAKVHPAGLLQGKFCMATALKMEAMK